MTITYNVVFTEDSSADIPPNSPLHIPETDPPQRGDVIRVGPSQAPFLVFAKVYTAISEGNTEITLVLQPGDSPLEPRRSSLDTWKKLGE